MIKSKSLRVLILSGCLKIDKLEEDIVQMESLTTLMADNTSLKQVPFSIIRFKKIGFISLCGYEGLAGDLFPSIIWSWMSPTTGRVSSMQSFGSTSTSLVSVHIQDNNLGNLLSKLSEFSKLRSICVQCNSDLQLTQELRRIVDDFYKVHSAMETTYAPQISENSVVSRLIGIGSHHQVMDMLRNDMTEVGSISLISRLSFLCVCELYIRFIFRENWITFTWKNCICFTFWAFSLVGNTALSLLLQIESNKKLPVEKSHIEKKLF